MKKGEHEGRPAPGDRGLYDFAVIRDQYGKTVTVRSSSSFDSSGRMRSAVWLFTQDDEGKSGTMHMGEYHTYSPLLGVREAKMLRDALDRFIEEAGK